VFIQSTRVTGSVNAGDHFIACRRVLFRGYGFVYDLSYVIVLVFFELEAETKQAMDIGHKRV
jgi:hypothetical protein